MANVYSTRLWEHGVATAGFYTSGAVPAGFVWVVRSWDAINYGTLYEGCWGFSAGRNGGAFWWGNGPPFVQSNQPWHWEGHQVLNAGEELVFATNDNEWTWSVSGFVLTLP